VLRAVRWLIHVSLNVFFRRIEVVGAENVPPEGAVLFCGNHPNSLLDPMLIMDRGGRTVRFAAADVLFDNAVLRFFLTRLQAVPVRRRQDHEGGAVDNQAAFDTLFQVLADGAAMGIFPEGVSHQESDLSTFRTGPARIALGAKAAYTDRPICIVPVGLHYTNRNRFRSAMVIRFGAPIVVDQVRLSAWREDERAEVRRLTDAIEEGVRDLAITAENWETIRALDVARRLYQPPRISLADRVELAHRFSRGYQVVAEEPTVRAFFGRALRYQGMLDAVGMTDGEVRDFGSHPQRFVRGLRLAFSLIVLVPLALIGAPIHLPLAVLLRWGGPRFAPRKDVIATTKFIVGVLLTVLLYALTISVVYWFFGWIWAIWTCAILPISGRAFIAVLSRVRRLTQLSRLSLASLFVGPSFFRQLHDERAELVEQVDQLISTYLPPDMNRMYAPVAEREPTTQEE
jgi:1-acyl-sn-glycerol-3-phosphate acyltransferase